MFRLTKKWLVVIIAALFAALIVVAVCSCSLFQVADAALMDKYDTNKDGVLSPEEEAAMRESVKSSTTSNLPFPADLIGGLLVGLGTTAYAEWKRRQAMKAAALAVSHYDADEVEKYLKPENNATLNKIVAKKKK